jgi:hypothetical protein
MQVLVLIALIAVGFTLDHAWCRSRIRATFVALGRTVVAIRWQPFAGLAWMRARRNTSTFRVDYLDRDGQRFTCRSRAGLFSETRIEDERRAAKTNATATRYAASARGETPVAFYVACALAALVSCAWIGVSYWSAPYRSVQLPDGLYGLGLASVCAFAFALTAWRRDRWFVVLAVMTGAVVAVVAVRIARDVASDPSSHGLAGIEVFIAGFVGLVAAAFGVACGRLVRRGATSHLRSVP